MVTVLLADNIPAATSEQLISSGLRDKTVYDSPVRDGDIGMAVFRLFLIFYIANHMYTQLDYL